MRLDCETVETTYASLQCILHLSRDEIERRLDDFASPSVLVPESDCVWEFLVDYFNSRHLCATNHQETCWFHGTRTHEPEAFRNGILNLSARVEPTWAFLYSLVADQISQGHWNRFKIETEKANYGLREAWPARLREQGPCGFFIRDVLLKPLGHNYFRMPELVDHILGCFKHEWPAIDLRDIYWRATSPYVVKLKTRRPTTWHVGAALFYLYVNRNKHNMKSYVWPNYVGDGTPVPGRDVLAICSLADV